MKIEGENFYLLGDENGGHPFNKLLLDISGISWTALENEVYIYYSEED